MSWYREHARELPWRGIHDPYATWLSEIMLQQTRVATVIDRYGEFLRHFPTLASLAAAEEDAVLALWSGLGYYRRARMLHRGAQFVVRELDGKLPRKAAELRTLPGVGEYTAAAIGSIAFGESIAVVDGNVERVLLRILGLPEDKSSAGRAQINACAQSLIPPAARASRREAGLEEADRPNPAGDHNQAMMELGATICLPREPLCLQCPVVSLCRTRGEHPTQPRGQQQSRLAAYLLAVRKRGRTTEVLLERRPAEASLMPGMLELPPLPLAAVESREPVLRLRHGITNTNYLVQIYSEGARGETASADAASSTAEEAGGADARQGSLAIALRSEPNGESSHGACGSPPQDAHNGDEAVFEAALAPCEETSAEHSASLLGEIPASPSDLEWTPVGRLRELPLTGLARKCLQRLHLMPVDIRHSR